MIHVDPQDLSDADLRRLSLAWYVLAQQHTGPLHDFLSDLAVRTRAVLKGRQRDVADLLAAFERDFEIADLDADESEGELLPDPRRAAADPCQGPDL